MFNMHGPPKSNGQWHVMVSSGTPGDSVQLLRPPPTQSAKPSTARVPAAAQPAAQLDAESQAQRRSGAHMPALPDRLQCEQAGPQLEARTRAKLLGVCVSADWVGLALSTLQGATHTHPDGLPIGMVRHRATPTCHRLTLSAPACSGPVDADDNSASGLAFDLLELPVSLHQSG